MGKKKVTGVICNRRVSARVWGKVWKTRVKSVMLYRLEAVALRKRKEVKPLFSLEVTVINGSRNDNNSTDKTIMRHSGEGSEVDSGRGACT